jgi:hypothetical protein
MAMGKAPWLKTPLLLGGAPLAAGISVFLLWACTRWQWLILVGLCVLCAGLVSVIAGLIGVGIAITKMVRTGFRSRRLMANAAIVAMILTVNFPVAGGIVWSVINLLTQYRVVVRNQASEPIERAALNVGGISVPIGEIKPGASVTRKFYITGDGTLIFSGELNRKQLNTVVEGYVTNSVGGDKEIRVFMDGAIDVRSK